MARTARLHDCGSTRLPLGICTGRGSDRVHADRGPEGHAVVLDEPVAAGTEYAR